MTASLTTPKTYTAKNLVFSDPFSGTSLNAAYWNTYMTSNSTQGGAWDSDGAGGSGVGGPLDADYFEPGEVSVENGLTLNAVQRSVLGANWLDGQVRPQTFPVAAGVVSSYGKMEFTGGYLQISMKEPGGNGSWPGLWLLPGAGAGSVGNNFEIDIQEGGFYAGSANPNDVFAYHLHTPSGTFGGVVDTGIDLTAAFHTYAIDWKPGKSITWFLDGAAIATITSAEAPIPDEPMELIMSNQVATSAASSWRTSLDGTSPQSMPMQIDGVQLYQIAGSGETIKGSNVAPASAPVAAPRVTISTSGATTTQAQQTISGTVDAADAGTTVSIYDGSRLIGSAVAGSNGRWSARVTLANQGANALTASAANSAGKGVSAPVAFVLHTSAPKVTISTSGGAVAQAKQTISGAIDAADAGATVSIYDGGRVIGSAVAGANGRWSASVTLANAGSNAVTATAKNVAGLGRSGAVQFVLSPPAAAVTIQNDADAQTYALGDKSYRIALGGYGNTISAGDGFNVISPGAGNATVSLGGGNNRVTLSGYGNTVVAGDGANSVSGGAGHNTVKLGNGGNTVRLGGFYNQISVGDGANAIDAGAGDATITAGRGANVVTLNGYYNQVRLGAGANVLEGGQGHDDISLFGGSASLNLNGAWERVTLENGVNATISDLGTNLRVDIDTDSGNDFISGLAQHSAAVIALLSPVGGFSSASDVLGALRTDGHSGSLLTLGAHGSLDIVGVAPSHLSAANFAVIS